MTRWVQKLDVFALCAPLGLGAVRASYDMSIVIVTHVYASTGDSFYVVMIFLRKSQIGVRR